VYAFAPIWASLAEHARGLSLTKVRRLMAACLVHVRATVDLDHHG
jgi:hypothetical protein